MTGDYPDERAGPFESTPRSFTDGEGRDVEVRTADADDYEGMVAMYVDYHPEDRAQGIPPVREAEIREWVADLLRVDCVNVLACHDGRVVGHATLVPDAVDPAASKVDTGSRGETTDAVARGEREPHDEYELAIFVTRDYQGAGIGTELLEGLLGRGQEVGIERVWLTVERWNKAALSLYRSVGFVTSDAETFELEMAIRL